MLVSLDTDELTTLLDLPLSLANFLHYRLAATEWRRAEVRIQRRRPWTRTRCDSQTRAYLYQQ
jgi:hypothetical protein